MMSSLLSKRLRGEVEPTKWSGAQRISSQRVISERVTYRCLDTAFSTRELSQRIKNSDAPYLKLLSVELQDSPRCLEIVLS